MHLLPTFEGNAQRIVLRDIHQKQWAQKSPSEDNFQNFEIFSLLSLSYRNKNYEIEGRGVLQNGNSQQTTQILTP